MKVIYGVSLPQMLDRAGVWPPIGGPLSSVVGWSVSASGLAAVWAEDNTRESLLSVFQRKEVYATT
jgi:hypothetical protein